MFCYLMQILSKDDEADVLSFHWALASPFNSIWNLVASTFQSRVMSARAQLSLYRCSFSSPSSLSAKKKSYGPQGALALGSLSLHRWISASAKRVNSIAEATAAAAGASPWRDDATLSRRSSFVAWERKRGKQQSTTMQEIFIISHPFSPPRRRPSPKQCRNNNNRCATYWTYFSLSTIYFTILKKQVLGSRFIISSYALHH